jgi:ABC-type nitrate/sulfonate/bicarbonate transport system permease component
MAALEHLPVQEAMSLRALRASMRFGSRVASVVALVLVWQAISDSGIVTAFQLPSFTRVLARIWDDAVAGDLWVNTAVTLYRALIGFAIASVGGIALGMAMSRLKLVNWFFDPLISVGFPMPKIAFLPVIILWLGRSCCPPLRRKL